MNKRTLLDKLVMQKKQETEVLSMEEIRSQVMNHPVDEKVVSRKTQLLKKTTMITTFIATAGLLLWALFPAEKIPDTPGINVTFVPQEQENVPAVSPLQKSIPRATDTENADEGVPDLNEDLTKSILDAMAEAFDQEGGGTEKSVDLKCGLPPGLLMPDSAKLWKLGIVMDNGILISEQKNTPEHGDILFVYHPNGKQRTTFQNRSLANVSGLGNKLVPAFITTCRGDILFAYKEKNLKNESKKLLSFIVKDPGSANYFQFWYYPGEELFRILELKKNDTSLKSGYEPPKTVTTDFSVTKEDIWIPKKWANDRQRIRPGKDMLNKLGIKEKDKKINLNREKLEVDINGIMLSVNRQGEISETAQSVETDSKKLLPLFISLDASSNDEENLVTSLVTKDHNKLSGFQDFLSQKDKLIAIELGPSGWIFWYPASPALKELLDEETLNRIQNYRGDSLPNHFKLAGERPEFNDLNALYTPQAPGHETLRALELSVTDLFVLGLELVDGQVLHHQYYSTDSPVDMLYGKKYSIRYAKEKKDAVHTIAEQEKWIKANKALWFITDDLGSNYRLFSVGSEKDPELKDLIPVLVRSGGTYSIKDKLDGLFRPDLIFWYEPTEEFLNLLPAEVADDIRKSLGAIKGFKDLEVVKKPVDSASCKYVETCKNRKGVIQDYKLYPNPASNITHVEFTLAVTINLHMELFTIDGRKVKEFVPVQVNSANNRTTLDISGLVPGVYLLQLRSDQGDSIHERLIITGK